MSIGTAGFTAMLCVMALEHQGVEPGDEIIVTGAGGGVGSVAVAVLSKLGYKRDRLHRAASRRHDYLRSLGRRRYYRPVHFQQAFGQTDGCRSAGTARWIPSAARRWPP